MGAWGAVLPNEAAAQMPAVPQVLVLHTRPGQFQSSALQGYEGMTWV